MDITVIYNNHYKTFYTVHYDNWMHNGMSTQKRHASKGVPQAVKVVRFPYQRLAFSLCRCSVEVIAPVGQARLQSPQRMHSALLGSS